MAEETAKSRKKPRVDDSVAYSSLATHPQAQTQIRMAKAWGGLIGFVVAAALSLAADVPVIQCGIRALIFGFVGYLVAWAAAMLVWRGLMMAQLRVAAEQVIKRREEQAEALRIEHERRQAVALAEAEARAAARAERFNS